MVIDQTQPPQRGSLQRQTAGTGATAPYAHAAPHKDRFHEVRTHRDGTQAVARARARAQYDEHHSEDP